MEDQKLRFHKIIISLALALFFILPIVWIFIVSIQPGDIAYEGRYDLIPQKITLDAYKQTFIDSLNYSFVLSGISAILAMFFALTATYLIKSDIISRRWQVHTVRGIVGLFFLPAFVVLPGLKILTNLLNCNSYISFKLILVHTIFGFVTAFMLLLFVYTSSQKSYFDQLLLETQSRLRAFYFGIVFPNLTGTFIVCAFTFASIWSEFLLTDLISGTQQLKPFSVKLQMAQGQYGTNYSIFAAGAILSLFFWVLAFIIISITGYLSFYFTTKEHN